MGSSLRAEGQPDEAAPERGEHGGLAKAAPHFERGVHEGRPRPRRASVTHHAISPGPRRAAPTSLPLEQGRVRPPPAEVVVTTALSSSERAMQRLPPHLRRYVVAQDYDAYTPRDQAVWRHILRRLVRHLASRAHPSYLRGLEATGIGTERIPSMDEMNDKLARLGWSAVAVRGFIPPAVFTELQADRKSVV